MQPENLQASRFISNLDRVQHSPNYQLIFNPQTSGGLLAAVLAEQANACLTSLQALGYSQSCIIGCVLPQEGEAIALIESPKFLRSQL